MPGLTCHSRLSVALLHFELAGIKDNLFRLFNMVFLQKIPIRLMLNKMLKNICQQHSKYQYYNDIYNCKYKLIYMFTLQHIDNCIFLLHNPPVGFKILTNYQ